MIFIDVTEFKPLCINLQIQVIIDVNLYLDFIWFCILYFLF